MKNLGNRLMTNNRLMSELFMGCLQIVTMRGGELSQLTMKKRQGLPQILVLPDVSNWLKNWKGLCS
jgi:hypothetical protein